MKQLVILSGKGGTGKTSIAAAFAHLAGTSASRVSVVLADADVDAANLELILQAGMLEEHDFYGGKKAAIDPGLCQGCGYCETICRFNAIIPPSGAFQAYKVDPIACDGCAACIYHCPYDAIRMLDQLSGRWFRSESKYAPLIHAQLYPTQENSGKLVTMVKQQARLYGMDHEAKIVLIDGPPGIGCPVISAAAGADLALIVAEPTTAGIHDMERALRMVAHFKLKPVVCINKADIYPAGSYQIEEYCCSNGISVLGWIPFDQSIMQAMKAGMPVTAHLPDSKISQALTDLWEKVIETLDN